MLSENGDCGWLMATDFLLLVGSFVFHLKGILVLLAVNHFGRLM